MKNSSEQNIFLSLTFVIRILKHVSNDLAKQMIDEISSSEIIVEGRIKITESEEIIEEEISLTVQDIIVTKVENHGNVH